MGKFLRLLAALSIAFVGVCSTPAEIFGQVAPHGTEYRLSPEDQLSIQVEDLAEIASKIIRVDPSGNVDLPLVGVLKAGGLTPEEFKAALAAKLTIFITSPRISINVLEYHSSPVSVIGEVNNPGVHQLQGEKRLVEIISIAGGLRADAGSRLVITRELKQGPLQLPGAHNDAEGKLSIAEVSLDSLMASRNPSENILVLPGDILSIPRAEIVYVLGQVKKAGGFTLNSHDSMSLLRALSMAEGLDHDAAPKKARLLQASPEGTKSKPNELVVDVQSILDGKTPDFDMHANDVLYIPNNLAKSATRRAMEAALQIGTGVLIYR